MGMANLPLIAEELIAHGRPAETPVAIVRWATTPRQQTLTATLGDVVEKVREAGIKPPAVIIVGEVVELREKLRWFDNRPLFGKRVMVTRTPEQAREFIALLAVQGAEAVCCPTIAVAEPESWTDLDAGIADLDRTDFLILTSTNAVDAFFSRLAEKGADVRSLAGVQIVAVGPKTAGAIRARGVSPDLVPEDYRAEGVVALLKEQEIAGKRILYPRTNLARDLIPAELAAVGAEIVAPVAYRTVAPAGGGELIRELLTTGEIDAVTFTSSSTVENFVEMVGPDAAGLLKKVDVISIGPLTTRTAGLLGLKVAVQPPTYTLDGMLEAMIEHYSGIRSQVSGIRKGQNAGSTS
jgi:uroporphyrinogen III methyltransferase/synthase